MTQTKENANRISEFSAHFLALNEKGQDTVLTVLRSLGFAQSVISLLSYTEKPCKPPIQTK